MIFQQLSSCYWPFKFHLNSLKTILLKKRSPRCGEILPRQYSPMYVRKVRLRARPGPRWRPPRQPRRLGKVRWADRQARYLREGILRENLEAAGVSSWEGTLPILFKILWRPNLNSIKRQSTELYFSSVYSFKRSFKQLAFNLLFWSQL